MLFMDNNRDNILNALNNAFIKNSKVYALWLEGADALDKTDEYSDIDIWVDVEDNYIDTFIELLKQTLTEIAPIDFIYEPDHEHVQIRQLFLHLKNMLPFLIIDLCIQSHSREIEFVTESSDEKVKIIFDKSDIIKYTNLDLDAFTESMRKRQKEILHTVDFFSILVIKEIRRNNFL